MKPNPFFYPAKRGTAQALRLMTDPKKPWLIVLHGHGADYYQVFTRADLKAFPRLAIDAGFNLISPDLGGNSWLDGNAEERLCALIETLPERSRIILWGGSMGGTMALSFCTLHPELCSAIVALCPAASLNGYYHWLEKQEEPALCQIRETIALRYGGKKNLATGDFLLTGAPFAGPIFLSHAEDDPIIPITFTDRAAELLGGRSNFRYLRHKAGGHDGPLIYFRNRVALDFLIKQIGE